MRYGWTCFRNNHKLMNTYMIDNDIGLFTDSTNRKIIYNSDINTACSFPLKLLDASHFAALSYLVFNNMFP